MERRPWIRFRTFAWVAGALGLLALAAVLFLSAPPPEPAYAGRPLSSWVAEIDSPRPAEREGAEAAVRAVGREGVPTLAWLAGVKETPAERAVLGLERKLPSQVWRFLYRRTKPYEAAHQRRRAVRALSLLLPEAPEAVPVVAAALTDADPAVRSEAASGLAGLGPASVPHLVRALEVLPEPQKGPALVALGRIGEPAEPIAAAAVRVLVEASSANSQMQAQHLLAQLGPAVVPPLLSVLAEGVPDVRERLIEALRQCADMKFAVLTNLIDRCSKETPRVRLALLEAIGETQLAPPLVEAAMTHASKDEDADVRRRAEGWLRRHGTPSAPPPSTGPAIQGE